MTDMNGGQMLGINETLDVVARLPNVETVSAYYRVALPGAYQRSLASPRAGVYHERMAEAAYARALTGDLEGVEAHLEPEIRPIEGVPESKLRTGLHYLIVTSSSVEGLRTVVERMDAQKPYGLAAVGGELYQFTIIDGDVYAQSENVAGALKAAKSKARLGKLGAALGKRRLERAVTEPELPAARAADEARSWGFDEPIDGGRPRRKLQLKRPTQPEPPVLDDEPILPEPEVPTLSSDLLQPRD